MIVFENCFDYPKLQRLETGDGRKYVTPSGQMLPSVTTILGATKTQETKDGLAKWAKRVGVDEAERTKTQAANLGTIIHKNLERYMLGEPMQFGTNLIYKMAEIMTKTVIEKGFSKIQKIYGQEVPIYMESLYAGTADLIVEIDGEIWLVDFKNTIKMKKEEYLADYYCQLVAYSLAHNSMFGTNIRRGRVMMIARPDDLGNAEYKEFDLDPEKFSKFEDVWLSKLEQFYANK